MRQSKKAHSGRKPAFTLLELLIVIAIIAILIGLTIPAVQRVREAANRISCQNNLHQIGLALHSYHDANGSLPPGSVPEMAPWTVYILPFLEQEALFNRYDMTKKNDDPANLFVRSSLVKVYVCPSDAGGPFDPTTPRYGYNPRDGYAPGSYRGVAGKSTAETNQWFDSQIPRETQAIRYDWRGPLHVTGRAGLTTERLTDVTDGTSNTLLVGEYTTRTNRPRRTYWAYSWNQFTMSSGVPQQRTLMNDYDACVAAGGVGLDQPCKRAWGSFHSGTIQFLNCDGSVRGISTSIDPELFSNLTTIAGGELSVE